MRSTSARPFSTGRWIVTTGRKARDSPGKDNVKNRILYKTNPKGAAPRLCLVTMGGQPVVNDILARLSMNHEPQESCIPPATQGLLYASTCSPPAGGVPEAFAHDPHAKTLDDCLKHIRTEAGLE